MCLKIDERKTMDDGFSHRINCNAPRAPIITAKEIRNACKKISIMTFSCIFLFIKLLHALPRVYTLDDEAGHLFDEMFDQYRMYVDIANKSDSFLG
jgi:hypothetical protein